MADPVTIRVRDIRRYLNGFSDDAVVLRQIGDATMEGAYVDLNVAMAHLEEELRVEPVGGEDDAAEEEAEDSSSAEIDMDDDVDDDPDRELDEMRSLVQDQERSVRNWENDQR